MGQLGLISLQNNKYTVVSDCFLDRYMPRANGEFVKVYLLLLRYSDECRNIDLAHIADVLNMTESDIIRALRYWNEAGVLSVSFDDKNYPVSVSFTELKSGDNCTVISESAAASEDSSSVSAESVIPSKTSHSPSELLWMKEQEDNSQLFFIAEQLVGMILKNSDMNTLLYIRDELHFCQELIEYLIEYCVSNGHSSFRYMETVAISWFKKGITTVEEAKTECAMYSSRVSPVLKAFGIRGRNITDGELDFINRWYDEYGFDNELITEACQRTVLALGKPSFSYADGILRKWKTAGVHTVKDLPELDASVRATVKVPVGTASQNVPHKNRFNNFPQREYKYDELEKKLTRK